ncbi:MAG TPA: transglutaminase family protein [Ensifer sp.]|jgi:transglutaminase-like putative cysteine protease|uniref:transglutaminase-like domain-containing protein n=1 Tax=Ensifer sp. TaxID=1872086 RepID=UPI002E13D34A|nr:transglutaminase family protein [Ensifer sp.]
MKIRISADLTYRFAEPTQIIGLLEAASSDDQTVVSETLTLSPKVEVTSNAGIGGERRIRTCVTGEATMTYRAEVDNGDRALLPRRARQHLWGELPQDVLPYLLPSRFCPSDQFQRFALREFGDAGDGAGRVMAIMDWICRHVDYVPAVSTAETDAAHTFIVRAGVCRDFTHLGITLCRALSIPSRAVSAYAVDLRPPDFHAVIEVFLENRWWLVDPTRLAPVAGLVRIANGRDAADIAFLSTDKPCQLVSQAIIAERVD